MVNKEQQKRLQALNESLAWAEEARKNAADVCWPIYYDKLIGEIQAMIADLSREEG